MAEIELRVRRLILDPDDERDINAAVAKFQAANARWDGALLPDGDSDTLGGRASCRG